MIPLADAQFRALRGFNDPELAKMARAKHRLSHRSDPYFPERHRLHALARALGRRRAVDLKEFLESAEVWVRTKRRLRGDHLADLCCGHGLTGVIFALLEEDVKQVFLVDMRRPASHDQIMAAAHEVDPERAKRVQYLETAIEDVGPQLPHGTALLAVHACGPRTDRCIDLAEQVGGPIAVMPCCYGAAAKQAPQALREALGAHIATDVHRTYRLESLGYRVDWSAIPAAITPMNRVLIGWLPPELTATPTDAP